MKTRAVNRSGFTLVEIMIVVAIIGLLAAIAVPNFMKSRDKAQCVVCIANLQQIEYAQQQWAFESKKSSSSATVLNEITAYLKNNVLPVEPAGGNYTLGATVKDPPICSNSSLGHTI
jgi:prepilin-type N-terminal cleavage/methylation domain-containing protein